LGSILARRLLHGRWLLKQADNPPPQKERVMHEIQITVTSNTTADVRLGKTPRRQARRQLHGREHPSSAQPPDRLNRQTGAIEDGTTSARTKNLEGPAELARWPGRRTHARLLAGGRGGTTRRARR
jgi:hypothetical protein